MDDWFEMQFKNMNSPVHSSTSEYIHQRNIQVFDEHPIVCKD